MQEQVIINPNIRTHFVPYVLAKKNKIKTTIDQKSKEFPNIKDLLPSNPITDILNEILVSNFNDLEAKLETLENLVEKEFHDEIFLFLHSNFIFVGLLKKNKLNSFPKIIEIYNLKLKQFDLEIKEFHELKSVKECSKTLDETSKMIKQTNNVVTRFPPEPSGYLHLGHAKAALLNNHFARENNGTLIVRFDDTNPIKEEQSYVDAIISDLNHLLNIKEDKLSYTSDYFDVLIQYAKFLICEGKAYCDNTDLEIMRNERGEGIESKNRDSEVQVNTNIFNKMIAGEASEYCLRAKIDMKNVNKAMRDPVIYRCVDIPHHRTGNKYKVYPTYDFCCPIVDSLECVTHTLRTNEYRDRNEQYYWFIKNLNLKHVPKIKDFSRLNFENTVLSKRKLKKIVDKKNISWEDPRMPTLRGIQKLGMDFDVLKNYILMQGVGQKTCKVSWDKIWALNKKKIDNESGKYFGIIKSDSINAVIENFEELKTFKQNELGSFVQKDLIKEIKKLNISEDIFYFEMHKNKKNEDLGLKRVKVSKELILPKEEYKINEEITLMQLGNFIVKATDQDNVVLFFNCKGSYKDTKLKVQWVSAKNYFMTKFYEYGDLCKNEEGEFNEDSKKEYDFICEKEVEFIEQNTVIQIERIGFYYFDGNNYNLVPFTKQARKK
ncbi:hypothetical protein COBT_002527 [Conglomerata obtusa]